MGKRGTPATVLESPRTDRNPRVSPDGRWMAFESDRTGRFEIYVSPFPDVKSGAQQVTTSGARDAGLVTGSEAFVLLDQRWRHGHDHGSAASLRVPRSAGVRRNRSSADRSSGRPRTTSSMSGTTASWCSRLPRAAPRPNDRHRPELVRRVEAARTSALNSIVPEARRLDRCARRPCPGCGTPCRLPRLR